MPEADLYPPIKRFLEERGYAVKGEIGACDVVAARDGEAPIVVELKESLNLALVLQAVDRLAVSDAVYVAFRVGREHSASWRSRSRAVRALLRRLGLGLLTVSAKGSVTAVLDPAPYRPRPSAPRRARLALEFAARVGDPEAGGSASRARLTAYRQDALRCMRELAGAELLAPREIRARAAVTRAGQILRDNHYGWFVRVSAGQYALSPKGRRALADWSEALATLPAPQPAASPTPSRVARRATRSARSPSP